VRADSLWALRAVGVFLDTWSAQARKESTMHRLRLHSRRIGLAGSTGQFLLSVTGGALLGLPAREAMMAPKNSNRTGKKSAWETFSVPGSQS